MSNPLAKHIEDPISEARLERIWQGVSARQDEYQPVSAGRRVALTVGGFAIAAGIALGWFYGAPLQGEPGQTSAQALVAEQFQAGAALRTGAEKISVDLEDGSKVVLSPRSRLAMQQTHSADVALTLEEGRVSCNVAKEKERTFSVVAGDVTVRVVGTEFSVERSAAASGERIAVDVREGIVEVIGPDGVHKRLAAGESWSLRVDSDAGSGGDEAQEKSEGSAVAKAPAAARVKSRSSSEPFRDLFAEARAKKNAGDSAGAARLYQKFLDENGRDARAGVAALELGRIKMDQLGDVAGAIGPLSRAASQAGGGLGDDALARLARAHAQMGRVAECQSVRARYFAVYPKGVHVEQVRALCP